MREGFVICVFVFIVGGCSTQNELLAYVPHLVNNNKWSLNSQTEFLFSRDSGVVFHVSLSTGEFNGNRKYILFIRSPPKSQRFTLSTHRIKLEMNGLFYYGKRQACDKNKVQDTSIFMSEYDSSQGCMMLVFDAPYINLNHQISINLGQVSIDDSVMDAPVMIFHTEVVRYQQGGFQ